ncbi:unnamed protein product, partial [Rotaria sp. Silwood2]
MTTYIGDTTKAPTEESSFAFTSVLSTVQTSTIGEFSTASESSITSSSLDVTRYTNTFTNVSEIMFSNATRLQTLLSSAPVSIFTSETDHTTTICHTFPHEAFTPVYSETTRTTTSTPASPVSIIRNKQSNATEIANALIAYFNQTVPGEQLTPDEIDYAVSRLNISVNSSLQNGFIMSQRPSTNDSSIVLGAVFLSLSGGKIVLNKTRVRDVNLNISVG